MKNINFIFFTSLIICITASYIKSQTLFTDNFENLTNWTHYGDPLPNHIDSIYGKIGVFDNNGDSWYNSGAISNLTFDLINGFILESEVYVDFYNLSGCWADAEIGIADPELKFWGGYDPYISIGLRSNGDACWVCPGITQRHALITGGYKTSTGWETYGDCNAIAIFADQFVNSWQILKIVVDQNGMPKFYIADSLIYSGSQPINETVLITERSIWLGTRSSGSAGKAYHNSISLDIFTIPVEITSFTAISNGKEVTLNWSTATELNNFEFEVQRSFEGSEFVTVGVAYGKGTTTERHDYTYCDKNLSDGKYFYRLKQVDYDGSYEFSDVVEIDFRAFTSYLLEQNYPNPFNPTTTIGFGIKEKSNVKIVVLNSIGEEVAVLLNEEKESGYHTVEFNPANLPSGVYFYQLKAGDYINTKKMLLLK